MDSARHLDLDELNEGLPVILQSPKDQGTLKAIVVRTEENQRFSPTECHLSPELGLEGDAWAKGCWLSLPDGSPHPDVQITIMNARAIDLIAQRTSSWSLAGDNLYIDLDLSDDNLPCGHRLSIGPSILEVVDRPHTGCSKFAQRFGNDAMRFVNSPEGTRLHLRGIYAKIIAAGKVKVGDPVCKTEG